jgi:hypothetical protein
MVAYEVCTEWCGPLQSPWCLSCCAQAHNSGAVPLPGLLSIDARAAGWRTRALASHSVSLPTVCGAPDNFLAIIFTIQYHEALLNPPAGASC